MQRPKPLPSLKDNMVLTRPNIAYSAKSPNLSRSWSPQEFRLHPDDRLTRSLGDRNQERHVLEWCKKNNVNNVVRKLPKLDPALLTTRGVNTEKFMKVVDEPPIGLKEPPPKNINKLVPATIHDKKTNYCPFCQRDVPAKGRRGRRTFFTSPYECEHCGASNHIDDDCMSGTSSPDSEATTITETVADTIRRGNPAQIIDHRNFPENSDDLLMKEADDVKETDIFWRDDASEYFEYVENLEDGMNELSLESHSAFLTEASFLERPGEIKMAWDDEENSHYADITRTIDTQDDGTETHDSNSEKQSFSKKPHPPGVSLSQKNDPVSGIKVRAHGRTSHDVSENNDKHTRITRRRRASLPGMNKSSDDGTGDSQDTMSEDEVNNNGQYNMIQSPVANRSIGMSRIALMRLTRQNRARGRGARSMSGTRFGEAQRSRTRSHSPFSVANRDQGGDDEESTLSL